MSKSSVTHATFVIDRTYDASPARVFAAWASKDAKLRWFGCNDEWVRTAYELDFRVGGREFSNTGPEGGTQHIYEAVYHDIVPNERIVYSFDVRLDEQRISVSLATVELTPSGKGTRFVFTEQIACLDGYDMAGREEGTRIGFENLVTELQREAA